MVGGDFPMRLAFCTCPNPFMYCCFSFWPIDPPSTSPFILNFTNGSDYYMIKGSNSTQQLTCKISGGNQLANLQWSCYSGTTENQTTNQTASQTVIWKAGSQESTCTCTAYHRLSVQNRSTSVNVKIICKYK